MIERLRAALLCPEAGIALLAAHRKRDRFAEELAVASGNLSSPPVLSHPALRVSRAVTFMARFVPIEADCVVRAGAARAMLQRRSIPHSVHFAARSPSRHIMDAHVWLQCGELVIGAAPTAGYKAFRPTIE